MINKLILFLYQVLPYNTKKKIGQSSLLKPIRDFYLRDKGDFRQIKILVKRNYQGDNVIFDFIASLKVAEKAKNKGIENTILRNSIELIKKYKRNENDIIVFDVGANFGYLSLVWANTISKEGEVFAFEPNSRVYHCFKKSIKLNNLETKIQLTNCAVGLSDGITSLFSKSTSSNVLSENEENKEKIEIEMISLDSFVENKSLHKCDLVKIDVDGIELDILKGARKMINAFNPIFIVETNNDNRIINFFNNLDYQVLDMKLNSFQSTTKLPLNVFCIPKSLIHAL